MSKLIVSKLISWLVSNKEVNQFISNLDKNKFKASSLSEVVVENLELRPGSLEKFPVPFDIRSGKLGRLRITWKGTFDIGIKIEDVHVILGPKVAAGRDDEELSIKRELLLKRERLDAWEQKLSKSGNDAQEGNQQAKQKPTIPRGLRRFLNDFHVEISKIHISYRDDDTNFAMGLTLDNLVLHPPDPKSIGTHVTKGFGIIGLAIYIDVAPLSLEVQELLKSSGSTGWQGEHTYLLSPMDITGLLSYPALGHWNKGDDARFKITANINEVAIVLDRAQWRAILAAMDRLSSFGRSVPQIKVPRPTVRIAGNAKLWWGWLTKCLYEIVRDRRMRCSKQFFERAGLDKERYVSLYTSVLLGQKLSKQDKLAYEALETIYCYEQLLLFRHVTIKRLRQNTLAKEWAGSSSQMTTKIKKAKAQKKLKKMQQDFLSTLTDAELREVSAIDEGNDFFGDLSSSFASGGSSGGGGGGSGGGNAAAAAAAAAASCESPDKHALTANRKKSSTAQDTRTLLNATLNLASVSVRLVSETSGKDQLSLSVFEIACSCSLWHSRLQASASVESMEARDCALKQPMLSCPSDGNLATKAVECDIDFYWDLGESSVFNSGASGAASVNSGGSSSSGGGGGSSGVGGSAVLISSPNTAAYAAPYHLELQTRVAACNVRVSPTIPFRIMNFFDPGGIGSANLRFLVSMLKTSIIKQQEHMMAQLLKMSIRVNLDVSVAGVVAVLIPSDKGPFLVTRVGGIRVIDTTGDDKPVLTVAATSPGVKKSVVPCTVNHFSVSISPISVDIIPSLHEEGVAVGAYCLLRDLALTINTSTGTPSSFESFEEIPERPPSVQQQQQQTGSKSSAAVTAAPKQRKIPVKLKLRVEITFSDCIGEISPEHIRALVSLVKLMPSPTNQPRTNVIIEGVMPTLGVLDSRRGWCWQLCVLSNESLICINPEGGPPFLSREIPLDKHAVCWKYLTDGTPVIEIASLQGFSKRVYHLFPGQNHLRRWMDSLYSARLRARLAADSWRNLENALVMSHHSHESELKALIPVVSLSLQLESTRISLLDKSNSSNVVDASNTAAVLMMDGVRVETDICGLDAVNATAQIQSLGVLDQDRKILCITSVGARGNKASGNNSCIRASFLSVEGGYEAGVAVGEVQVTWRPETIHRLLSTSLLLLIAGVGAADTEESGKEEEAIPLHHQQQQQQQQPPQQLTVSTNSLTKSSRGYIGRRWTTLMNEKQVPAAMTNPSPRKSLNETTPKSGMLTPPAAAADTQSPSTKVVAVKEVSIVARLTASVDGVVVKFLAPSSDDISVMMVKVGRVNATGEFGLGGETGMEALINGFCVWDRSDAAGTAIVNITQEDPANSNNNNAGADTPMSGVISMCVAAQDRLAVPYLGHDAEIFLTMGRISINVFTRFLRDLQYCLLMSIPLLPTEVASTDSKKMKKEKSISAASIPKPRVKVGIQAHPVLKIPKTSTCLSEAIVVDVGRVHAHNSFTLKPGLHGFDSETQEERWDVSGISLGINVSGQYFLENLSPKMVVRICGAAANISIQVPLVKFVLPSKVLTSIGLIALNNVLEPPSVAGAAEAAAEMQQLQQERSEALLAAMAIDKQRSDAEAARSQLEGLTKDALRSCKDEETVDVAADTTTTTTTTTTATTTTITTAAAGLTIDTEERLHAPDSSSQSSSRSISPYIVNKGTSFSQLLPSVLLVVNLSVGDVQVVCSTDSNAVVAVISTGHVKVCMNEFEPMLAVQSSSSSFDLHKRVFVSAQEVAIRLKRLGGIPIDLLKIAGSFPEESGVDLFVFETWAGHQRIDVNAKDISIMTDPTELAHFGMWAAGALQPALERLQEEEKSKKDSKMQQQQQKEDEKLAIEDSQADSQSSVSSPTQQKNAGTSKQPSVRLNGMMVQLAVNRIAIHIPTCSGGAPVDLFSIIVVPTMNLFEFSQTKCVQMNVALEIHASMWLPENETKILSRRSMLSDCKISVDGTTDPSGAIMMQVQLSHMHLSITYLDVLAGLFLAQHCLEVISGIEIPPLPQNPPPQGRITVNASIYDLCIVLVNDSGPWTPLVQVCLPSCILLATMDTASATPILISGQVSLTALCFDEVLQQWETLLHPFGIDVEHTVKRLGVKDGSTASSSSLTSHDAICLAVSQPFMSTLATSIGEILRDISASLQSRSDSTKDDSVAPSGKFASPKPSPATPLASLQLVRHRLTRDPRRLEFLQKLPSGRSMESIEKFAGVHYQCENMLAEKITVHVAVTGGRYKGIEIQPSQSASLEIAASDDASCHIVIDGTFNPIPGVDLDHPGKFIFDVGLHSDSATTAPTLVLCCVEATRGARMLQVRPHVQVCNLTDAPVEVAIAGAGPSNARVIRPGKACPVPLAASMFGEIFVRPIVPGTEYELGGPIPLGGVQDRSFTRFQLVSSAVHSQLEAHLPADTTVLFEFNASFVRRGMNVSGKMYVTDNGVAFYGSQMGQDKKLYFPNETVSLVQRSADSANAVQITSTAGEAAFAVKDPSLVIHAIESALRGRIRASAATKNSNRTASDVQQACDGWEQRRCRTVMCNKRGVGGGLQLAVSIHDETDSVDPMNALAQSKNIHPFQLQISASMTLENVTASLLDYEVYLDESSPVPLSSGQLLAGEHRALAGADLRRSMYLRLKLMGCEWSSRFLAYDVDKHAASLNLRPVLHRLSQLKIPLQLECTRLATGDYRLTLSAVCWIINTTSFPMVFRRVRRVGADAATQICEVGSSPVEFSHKPRGDRVAIQVQDYGWSKPLKLRSLLAKAELVSAGSIAVSAAVSHLSGPFWRTQVLTIGPPLMLENLHDVPVQVRQRSITTIRGTTSTTAAATTTSPTSPTNAATTPAPSAPSAPSAAAAAASEGSVLVETAAKPGERAALMCVVEGSNAPSGDGFALELRLEGAPQWSPLVVCRRNESLLVDCGASQDGRHQAIVDVSVLPGTATLLFRVSKVGAVTPHVVSNTCSSMIVRFKEKASSSGSWKTVSPGDSHPIIFASPATSKEVILSIVSPSASATTNGTNITVDMDSLSAEETTVMVGGGGGGGGGDTTAVGIAVLCNGKSRCLRISDAAVAKDLERSGGLQAQALVSLSSVTVEMHFRGKPLLAATIKAIDLAADITDQMRALSCTIGNINIMDLRAESELPCLLQMGNATSKAVSLSLNQRSTLPGSLILDECSVFIAPILLQVEERLVSSIICAATEALQRWEKARGAPRIPDVVTRALPSTTRSLLDPKASTAEIARPVVLFLGKCTIGEIEVSITFSSEANAADAASQGLLQYTPTHRLGVFANIVTAFTVRDVPVSAAQVTIEKKWGTGEDLGIIIGKEYAKTIVKRIRHTIAAVMAGSIKSGIGIGSTHK